MTLHPGAQERHFPAQAPVAWDPIRRNLEENQDWYRDLVEHSQDLLCVHDLEGQILSINPVPARLLGYSVEEMLSMRLRDFIDARFHTEYDAYLREIKQTGRSSGVVAVMTRSGQQRFWEYHNTLRTEGVPAPIVRGIAHDVTERVLAEKALRKINAQLVKTSREQELLLAGLTLFRTLLDQSNDAIEVINPETMRVLDVNEKACVELGYSREELLAMTVFDIDPQLDANSRDGMLQHLHTVGSAIKESVHRRKDGTTFPVEISLRIVRLDKEYVVAASRDITARKLAEERLREFERVVENLEDMVIVVDREYRYVLANRAFLSYRKMTREQVVGRRIEDILNPGVFDSIVKQRLDECFEGQVVTYEMTYHYPEVGERDLSLTYLPVEGPSGIERVAAVLRDITEKNRAEKALRESEFLFRTVYKRSPLGIALVDSNTGQFLQANPQYCKITGREEGELLGANLESITHPDDLEKSRELRRQVAEGRAASKEIEKRYLRPDGSVRWVRILVVPMWDEGETRRCQMALVEDVTESKRAEEALRTGEREQQKIAEQLEIERARLIEAQAVAKVGSWELELPSLDITWSEQTHRIFETDPSNFQPTRPGFVELVHPEDRAKVDAAFEASLEKGAPSTVEYRIVTANGCVKVLEERWKVFHDGQGRPARLMGTCQDITERKRTEEALRQSEERFRVALKNSPIAVFTQDKDLRYTWEYNSQLPWPSSEKLGKTPNDLFSVDEAARIMEVRRQVLETGIGVRHEVEVTVGGKKLYMDTTIEPLVNAEGEVIGLTGASTDVTELRETSEALREAKRRLTEEKLYLEQEIDIELGFGEIIGQSKALQSVMEQVGKVAGTDATVLLLGETGTGKELVARALHRLSRRANNSFIKMNCAAIPSGLLESELFGNEKGAFTGAVSKKIGRLELADKGTLFLDEIGEIPLALQPKLLRVLQDQEFERLGSTHTLKVDFRLIAATNRDLADSVRENEFRSDLYYRLNVFPIRMPPLRERRDDIRVLVEYFVQKCARRMNKTITSIPKKTLAMLMEWDWPGNVRELENFVERSVILTQGSVLVSPLSELQVSVEDAAVCDETLETTEREHIVRALRETRGQIGGPKGAATRLGLKRTTLQSKLKHLGINPKSLPER